MFGTLSATKYRFLVKVERMTKEQYESVVGEEYVEEEL